MRLNVPSDTPDPRSAGRQSDDLHDLSTGDLVKKMPATDADLGFSASS
jgi:hypothetical protein